MTISARVDDFPRVFRAAIVVVITLVAVGAASISTYAVAVAKAEEVAKAQNDIMEHDILDHKVLDDTRFQGIKEALEQLNHKLDQQNAKLDRLIERR